MKHIIRKKHMLHFGYFPDPAFHLPIWEGGDEGKHHHKSHNPPCRTFEPS